MSEEAKPAKGKFLLIAGAGGGLVAILLFGALFSYVMSSDEYGPDRQLDLAVKLLDEGRWDLADRIARDIEKGGDLTPARESVWNYVRGVAGVLATKDALDSPANRRRLWDSAAFLEKSRDAEWPLGYRGQGTYYLGFCYYNTYDWNKALETLSEVPDSWPERRSDALSMMVDCSLRTTPPEREQADHLLDEWEKIPGLSPSEKNRIKLSRAHLAFWDSDWETCDRLLSQIPDDSIEYYPARLGRGLWKLEDAKQTSKDKPKRKERLDQALADFREVMLASGTPPDTRRQSTYFAGITLRHLDRTKEAISTLSGVRQRNPQSAESIAAGIDEAEIQLHNGYLSDALETTRHVVNDLGDVRLYDERWLPLSDLRRRLLTIGRELRELEEFDSAIRLASYLPPVFPVADAVRLEAETFESWGEKLQANYDASKKNNDRDEYRRKVNSKFTLAGDRYRQLSVLELRSPEYADIVWHAIECYQRCSQLDQANELLQTYLQFEDRARRPRGLLALGQNYLNAGKWSAVIPPLERCLLEYPDHPSAYNVRLLMAQALVEQEKLEDATETLLKNLYDGNLRPDSQLWRDSLFALCNVIYQRGDRLFLEAQLAPKTDWTARLDKLKASHEELIAATNRLSEVTERYELDPRALEARYAMGRAYRAAANFPKQMIDSGQVTIDAVRRKLLVERKQLLEQSLASYRELRRALDETQGTAAEIQDQTILRNCFFGEADVLFELEQYEEAIDAYRNVGNRFMNEPESLEAFVQISECFKAMGQSDQARRILGQAEQLLARIPPEADPRFTQVTRAARPQWQQLLAWLKK